MCWRIPHTCINRGRGAPTVFLNGQRCCACSIPNKNERTIRLIGTKSSPGGTMPTLLSRFIVAAALLLVLAPPASADDYPNRPVRLIIPFPPGGSNDVVGR